MRLTELEQMKDGRDRRFVHRVRDAGGDEEFELTIAGPHALVEKVLAEAEIELTVDSGASEGQWRKELEELQDRRRDSMWELAALDRLDDVLKSGPGELRRETTVVAAVRPVKGHGTPFFVNISGFFLPGGASLVVFGSWVTFALGSVLPATGDQDLFMHLFFPSGPVVSASIFGGTTPDLVAFGQPPPFWFVPVYRVFGFAPGVCTNFRAFGV
jgi:hypothetical protein